MSPRAEKVIARCRELARITDVPGTTTRTFLSQATRDAHTLLGWWMWQAGMDARTDDAGNVRCVRVDPVSEKLGAGPGNSVEPTSLRDVGHPAANRRTLVMMSHLDTVPDAGAFDGPLGVLLGLAVLEELAGERLGFDVELIAFSEEEGVRFGFPFLGSMALVGQVDEAMLGRKDAAGVSVAEAIRGFELAPERIAETAGLREGTFAALEVHIEQGPVLDAAGEPLAVVEAIVGQSRLVLTFEGEANHAGTTPMGLRRDALAAAAAWIVEVETFAAGYKQVVATVGKLEVSPGAGNVIPGVVRATLDVRHPKDESRHAAVAVLVTKASHAGEVRGVTVRVATQSEQRAVPMDAALTARLQEAAERAGYEARGMFSGAGHDAMVVAAKVPTAMLFVRSPGGLSHHPDETVRVEDVEAGMAAVVEFVRGLG